MRFFEILLIRNRVVLALFCSLNGVRKEDKNTIPNGIAQKLKVRVQFIVIIFLLMTLSIQFTTDTDNRGKVIPLYRALHPKIVSLKSTFSALRDRFENFLRTIFTTNLPAELFLKNSRSSLCSYSSSVNEP